jgi:acyl dehydratase
MLPAAVVASQSNGLTHMTHVFTSPPTDRWFEDYPVGAVFELGSFAMTEAEIIAFARQYDPQDMHIDPAAAAQGPFGEVIASGWHTVGKLMQVFVANFLPKNGLAAPGIDELRWPRPVRPGDTLSVRATIQEARRSRSKPDRGLLHVFIEVLNQHNEVVLTMKPMNLVRCRPVAAGD